VRGDSLLRVEVERASRPLEAWGLEARKSLPDLMFRRLQSDNIRPQLVPGVSWIIASEERIIGVELIRDWLAPPGGWASGAGADLGGAIAGESCYRR
jgi:hypothetical protein